MVIPARETAPEQARDGQTLLLTSLRSASPKVLLNTDIGDRAVLETRRCGCLYDQLGCRLLLHTIRSSDKITELGVTFAVITVVLGLLATFLGWGLLAVSALSSIFVGSLPIKKGFKYWSTAV